MPKVNASTDALANELAALPHLNIAALREKWRVLFRAEPPPTFGPDLLRRSIAQKLQEDAHGTLSLAAQRDFNRIIAAIAKNPIARVELPRRIKPGAVLVRDWKGKTCRVTVRDKGFDYDGRTYSNLSEIARAITGTRWNGPRFFGLRQTESRRDTGIDSETIAKRRRPLNPAIKLSEAGSDQ